MSRREKKEENEWRGECERDRKRGEERERKSIRDAGFFNTLAIIVTPLTEPVPLRSPSAPQNANWKVTVLELTEVKPVTVFRT